MENDINVLIVEDEESIRKFIKINLIRNRFSVLEAQSGEEALKIIKNSNVKVVILDVMLPKMDGFEVCIKIREITSEIIIIILTARGQDMDKIMGFEFGADDYMVKPFNPVELIARIKAILRRTEKFKDSLDKIISNGIFRLDMKSNIFYKDTRKIELTPTEFLLIKILMQDAGKAFSRDEILNKVWGNDYFGDVKTVDVNIRRLREKIEEVPSLPKYIETVWGIGYRWRKE